MNVSDPLVPLADAIAERLWARLQERFTDRDSPRLISIRSAAERVGVCRSKLYVMIASGEIPEKVVRRIGRRTLVVSSELDRWISAR